VAIALNQQAHKDLASVRFNNSCSHTDSWPGGIKIVARRDVAGLSTERSPITDTLFLRPKVANSLGIAVIKSWALADREADSTNAVRYLTPSVQGGGRFALNKKHWPEKLLSRTVRTLTFTDCLHFHSRLVDLQLAQMATAWCCLTHVPFMLKRSLHL